MPSSKKNTIHEGSWVDINDASDSDSMEVQPDVDSKPTNPVTDSEGQWTKKSRRTGKKEEPQMIMPSIQEDVPIQPRKRVIKKMRDAKALKARPSYNATKTHNNVKDPALNHVKDFCFDILGRAFDALKVPLGYALAVYVLFGLMIVGKNALFNRVTAAISPICRVPGVSFFDLPFCHHVVLTNYTSNEAPPAEFDQLATIQARLESLVMLGAAGASIPVHMRRGEMSIRDLRAVVRYSNLASKRELVLEFDEFIDGAKKSALAYQRFNALTNRAVDRIVPAAVQAQRALDAHEKSLPSPGNAVATFLTNTVLAPFQPLRFANDPVLDNYLYLLAVTRREIQSLIDEAGLAQHEFGRLEEHLDQIHEIAVRDAGAAEGGRRDVLASLWYRLGAQRSRVMDFNRELRLLAHVGDHRATAANHVARALVELQGMRAELDELDERVRTGSGVTEVGARTARDDIPLGLHLESLQRGVERLAASNRKSREETDRFMRSDERRAIWEADLDKSRLIGNTS